jgi:hypothetical protein
MTDVLQLLQHIAPNSDVQATVSTRRMRDLVKNSLLGTSDATNAKCDMGQAVGGTRRRVIDLKDCGASDCLGLRESAMRGSAFAFHHRVLDKRNRDASARSFAFDARRPKCICNR